MSSKLDSSLGYRLKRVVKCFQEVWLDSLYIVHLVINNSKFLDDDQKDLIKLLEPSQFTTENVILIFG